MKRADNRLCRARRRRGFTLTEVLFSTALTGLILSQAVVALVSSQRVIEATLADVELSIQTHELREKLFYNINDDGGLMDVCESALSFENENKHWGNGVVFTPKKGKKNRVALGSDKRLAADSEKGNKWLTCGTMAFQGTNVFCNAVTGGIIRVNMDLSLQIGTRTYRQQHLTDSQIRNE